MSITPRDDKNKIRDIILADKYIVEWLGFKENEISTARDLAGEFDKTKKYINIYEKPNESTMNPKISLSVYQIDILAANEKTKITEVDLCLEQIRLLLNDAWATPVKRIEVLGNIGNITTSKPSQYQVGLQVGVYSQIFGKPHVYDVG